MVAKVAHALEPLRYLALGMSNTIAFQNEQIERINVKTAENERKVKTINKNVKRVWSKHFK